MDSRHMKYFLLPIALFLFVGCSANFELSKVKPIEEVPTKNKIPLRVALLLPNEFRTYIHVEEFPKLLKERAVFPMGEVLSKYAEMASRAVFTEVVVTEGTSQVEKIDATLLPQVVGVDWSDNIAIMIKWTLSDNSGRMIWVDTCRGVDKTPGLGPAQFVPIVNIFAAIDLKRKIQIMMENAIDEAFRKFTESLSSSYEVRRFALEMSSDK
jgi:hypothetical protein